MILRYLRHLKIDVKKKQRKICQKVLNISSKKITKTKLAGRATVSFFFFQPIFPFCFPHLQTVLSLHSALRSVRADPLAHTGHKVAHGLRGGQDVQRWWQSALVVKVTEPQFGSSKLPLLVLVILPTHPHPHQPKRTPRNNREEC